MGIFPARREPLDEVENTFLSPFLRRRKVGCTFERLNVSGEPHISRPTRKLFLASEVGLEKSRDIGLDVAIN